MQKCSSPKHNFSIWLPYVSKVRDGWVFHVKNDQSKLASFDLCPLSKLEETKLERDNNDISDEGPVYMFLRHIRSLEGRGQLTDKQTVRQTWSIWLSEVNIMRKPCTVYVNKHKDIKHREEYNKTRICACTDYMGQLLCRQSTSSLKCNNHGCNF